MLGNMLVSGGARLGILSPKRGEMMKETPMESCVAVCRGGKYVFAAEAKAGVFGEMNNACFDLPMREAARFEDVLAADGFDVARPVVDFEATQALIPFVAINALANHFNQSLFVGIKELKWCIYANGVEPSFHANIDAW